MKLYLHCGYHKTGSSFLQTLFARNRDSLRESGIHFPVASREYDMISGEISPGNGPELAKAIKENDNQKSSELIAGYVSDAKRNGCDSILISSENFFHSFEKQTAVELLTNVAENNGIESINALLYFRDPVSHAISTFKHRAKNGKLSDLSHWLETDYETMELIERFMEYRTRYSIQWTCRKYRSQSEHMAKSAFADWLGIDIPAIPEDDRVNTSLTLSELLAIQSLNKNRPAYIPFVREAFAAIPFSDKATDLELSRRYNAIASDKLTSYTPLIEEVNRLLPENEQLKLTLPAEPVDHTMQDNIMLSKKQLAASVAGIEAGVKSGRVLNKSKAILTKVVDKVNRKIKTLSA